MTMKVRIILRESINPSFSSNSDLDKTPTDSIPARKASLPPAPWQLPRPQTKISALIESNVNAILAAISREDTKNNQVVVKLGEAFPTLNDAQKANILVQSTAALHTEKIAKFVSKGMGGLVFELQNGHIFKMYVPIALWSSRHGTDVESEHNWYTSIMNDKFENQPESGEEITVFDVGKCNLLHPDHSIKIYYVEMARETDTKKAERTVSPSSGWAGDERTTRSEELLTKLGAAIGGSGNELKHICHDIAREYFAYQTRLRQPIEVKDLFDNLMNGIEREVRTNPEDQWPIKALMESEPDFFARLIRMYAITAVRMKKPTLDLHYGNVVLKGKDMDQPIFLDP